MTKKPQTLTRRTAIRNAMLLVGGVASVTQLASFERALAAETVGANPRFLSDQQLAMLERIADLIIPETDTPGAASVGVHRFIDLMLDGWASADTQQQIVTVFERIDDRAVDSGMANFLDGSSEQQLELMQVLDREAFAAGATDEFFRRLKKLVLFSYFSSEPGATQALRFDRFPGNYEPCLPLEKDGRAWFWLGHSYEL